jgi:hypothetical protein
MIEVTGGERVGQHDGSSAKLNEWTGIRLHQQGAIGRETAHYSGDRFTDRPTLQVVTGRKASQLRSRELASAELELSKRRYDAIGQVGKIGSDSRTRERNRTRFQLGTDAILHIQAHTDCHPPEGFALPPGLAQHPSQLAAVEHEIVGPFELQCFRDEWLYCLGDCEARPKADHFDAL